MQPISGKSRKRRKQKSKNIEQKKASDPPPYGTAMYPVITGGQIQLAGGAIDFQMEAGAGVGEPGGSVGAPLPPSVANVPCSHILFPNNPFVLHIGTIKEEDDWL